MLYVLMIPVVGPTLYFFLVYLPMELSAKQKRGLQQLATNMIDPKRALREASKAYAASPTARNAQLLAEVLINRRDGAAAEPLLQNVLEQIRERDPRVLSLLAEACRQQGKLTAALSYMDEAMADTTSGSRRAELTLARGCILEEMGRLPQAAECYQYAADNMGGEEARCRLAHILIQLGQIGQAEHILADVNKRLSVAPIHYRSQQAEWVKAAQVLRRNCRKAA